ncbi:MAG: hypothetical protein AAGI07_09745 [Bacteroidota bacterium]
MEYAVFEEIEKNTIHIKFSSSLPSVDSFNQYLNMLSEVVKNGKNLYLIFDASYAPYIPGELRKMQADWIKANQKIVLSSVIIAIYVIPNAIQRYVLNAIYLLQKPVVAYKIVSSFKAAINYLHKEQNRRNVA